MVNLAVEGLCFYGFDVVNFFDKLENFADPVLESSRVSTNFWPQVGVHIVQTSFPWLEFQIAAAFFANLACIELRLLGRIPQKVSHQRLIPHKVSLVVFLVWSVILKQRFCVLPLFLTRGAMLLEGHLRWHFDVFYP